MKIYDVIIAGGGPAGLMAAYTLAKNNIKTAVLERKKEIGTPVCCGEAVSEHALKYCGILNESYIDKKVKGFRVFFPNNTFFFTETKGFLINRDKFEKYMAAAAEKNRAKIFLKHTILKINRKNNLFSITTNNGIFFSRFLIGADGPKSTVDTLLFKNKTTLIPAIQYKLNASDYNYASGDFLDFFFTNLSPYYFWIFQKNNELNTGGGTADKDKLNQFIRARFPGRALKYKSFTRGLIPIGGIKDKIGLGNAFLTGDAAGLTNPLTFAGIYTALISGKLCAETISTFFKSGKKQVLKNYEKTIRKHIFTKKILSGIAKNCYNLPENVLNFIGDYLENGSYRKKNFIKFFKMASKTPEIFKYIPVLAAHRELLRYFKDKQW